MPAVYGDCRKLGGPPITAFLFFYAHRSQHAIPKGATLQEKLDFMRGLCGRMPSLLQSPCDKFMNTYGEVCPLLMVYAQIDLSFRSAFSRSSPRFRRMLIRA